MCCDFSPMVRVKLENDETIVMGLDTGAIATCFGKHMVVTFNDAKAKSEKLDSLRKTESAEKFGYTIPYLCLNIGSTIISLENISINENIDVSQTRTFTTPGTLGSDIAKDSVLVIDYKNRHLGIN